MYKVKKFFRMFCLLALVVCAVLFAISLKINWSTLINTKIAFDFSFFPLQYFYWNATPFSLARWFLVAIVLGVITSSLLYYPLLKCVYKKKQHYKKMLQTTSVVDSKEKYTDDEEVIESD